MLVLLIEGIYKLAAEMGSGAIICVPGLKIIDSGIKMLIRGGEYTYRLARAHTQTGR
jgi:hypothetical protein